MNPNYPFVAQRAAHRCEYCHAPEVIFNVAFEVDHILLGIETPKKKRSMDYRSVKERYTAGNSDKIQIFGNFFLLNCD